jgi:hypothetical protein
MVPYEKIRYNSGFEASHLLVNRSPHNQLTWYPEGRLMENRIFEFWRTTLVREQETLEPTWYPVGAGERGEVQLCDVCTQPNNGWNRISINTVEVQSHKASSPEVGTTEDVSGSWQRVSQFVWNHKTNEWVGIVIRRFSDECIIVEASGSSRHTPQKSKEKSLRSMVGKACTKVLVIATKNVWLKLETSQ